MSSPSETTPRIVVHAGMAKTGTSAVQKFLSRHREELARLGVSYPEHREDANGISSGNRDCLLAQDAEGHFGASPERIAKTLDTFEASGLERLLVSSEFFGSYLPSLAPLMPADTRYVLYVRDPLGLLESHYNQQVKRNGKTEKLRLVAPRAGEGIAGVDKLLALVPTDADVVLRPYHPALFEGGNIVADLLRAGALPEPEAASAGPGQVNASYTLAALEFKRAANHLPLGGLAPRLDRALQRCPVGVAEYSLLEPTEYDALRTWAVAELSPLIDRLGHTSLEPLRQLIAHAPQRPYRPQAASEAELRAVAAFLREDAPRVYDRLVEIAGANPGAEVPYPGFPFAEAPRRKRRWLRARSRATGRP